MCIDDETAALLEVCDALKLFDCVDGDPRSSHKADDGSVYPYVTLGFIGASPIDVVRALATELRAIRAGLPREPIPKLYVRSKPQVEKEPEGERFSARMRLAVPGINWSEYRIKHEGAPYLPALGPKLHQPV